MPHDINSRVSADLEQGVRPWMKPWSGEHAAAGTLAHELTHWTKHTSHLGRDLGA